MSNEINIYSSDEFNSSKFTSHGKVVGKIEGNILVFDLAGPFNQELINSLFQFRMKILEDWNPKKNFGILVKAQRSILLSPDGFNTWTDVVRKGVVKFRPVAQAWAIDLNVEGRALLLPKIQALYADVGITNEFFEDEVIAKIWLTNFIKLADLRS